MAAAAEMGVDIQNPRVVDPPQLFPGFGFYIEAYWRLHTCRPQAMSGISWIPWTAINDFAKRYEIEGVSYYRLQFFIERMDEAFRSYVNEKAEKEKEKDDGDFDPKSTQQKAKPFRDKISPTRRAD